ncbi:MAG: M48 family metalloprotease, partial [Pseudomonadota bacterium]
GYRQAPGRYFDGRSARPTPVVVALRPQGLAILGPRAAVIAAWPFAALQLAEPWRPGGGPARFLTADGDARLVIEDPGLIRGVLDQTPHLRGGRDGDLRPRLIAAIVGGVLLFAAGAYALIDLAAPSIAKALVSAERAQAWGDDVANLLVGDGPHAYCEEPAARAALDALTARLLTAAGAEPDAVSVEIANVDVVNALALPGGRLLLLRGLIEKAESAEEVAGVLAHEIGHALERHPIEGFGRALGAQLALLLIAPGGGFDIAAVATLNSYTRAAEREADDWALRILDAAGIDARPLGAFFRRLGGDGARPADGPLALFATHPNALERADLFTKAGGPALSDAEWTALQAACADVPEDGRRVFDLLGGGGSADR